jgi:hypothetical protein
MKTKALLLALATTALVVNTKAQTTFGLRAGVNFQNINGEDANGKDLDFKLKPGFNIGVNAEIPVAAGFYLQPGVLFTTKGAKDKDDDDIKTSLSYIEIPINFVFKPMLGTGKLILGMGPYVAFAVGGKASDANGNDKDIEFENEISLTQYGTGTPYARRLDVGGNLLAGYEFSNKFSFQLNAQLGMAKIHSEITGPGIDDDTKAKNTGFGVSLGYRF